MFIFPPAGRKTMQGCYPETQLWMRTHVAVKERAICTAAHPLFSLRQGQGAPMIRAAQRRLRKEMQRSMLARSQGISCQ